MLSLFEAEIIKSGNDKLVISCPALIYNYLKLGRRIGEEKEEEKEKG
jgi:hypothetical protein